MSDRMQEIRRFMDETESQYEGEAIVHMTTTEVRYLLDRVERLEDKLRAAMTWEERLNRAEQEGMQGHRGVREALTIKGAVHRERAEARALLTDSAVPETTDG